MSNPWPEIATYVGVCCREWTLALGFFGRCGLCGEVPRAKEEAA